MFFTLFFTAKESRKLIFMYLANDVIQNSKKKGPEFGKEFENVFPKAFEHMRNVEDKTRERLNRLLSIWGERGVYDDAQIADFKNAFKPQKHNKETDNSEPARKKAKTDKDKDKSKDNEKVRARCTSLM